MSKYNMKLDKDQIKNLCKLENVIGQLVNIDVSQNWLSNIPHREFLDSMYIVYRLNATCIFGDGFRETKTMLIDNDIVQYMAVEEQDLYMAAMRNIKPEILSMSELFPIYMPYVPCDKPYKVYTEDFLTDSKNGDFDTVGILYVITPQGDRIEINRYFKDGESDDIPGYAEIAKEEYLERKSLANERVKSEMKE